MDITSSQDTQANHSRFYRGWKHFRLAGPGALVAVGYIDPGNWATDIAGGSVGGYTLLSVVLISSLMAMFLQIMSARLGIATGKDLAELSREAWPRYIWPSWIMAELSIISTELAEVLGAAIALQLLFSIPIVVGVVLTVVDVLLVVLLQRWGMHLLTRLIVALLFIIVCGFLYELILAQPILGEIIQGFFPTPSLVLDSQLLYLTIGVIGATVMPHNLYLHSYLVLQERNLQNKPHANADARFNTVISLCFAMMLNSAIVIMSACVFHHHGHLNVETIHQAHHLMTPTLGTSAAGIIFAIMLLASGQSATITGTIAGQVIMEGFIKMRMKLWMRRLMTRGLALIPALIVIIYCGEKSTAVLLIGSQILLSLQLPFAMMSLITLTSNPRLMGGLVNSRLIQWLGWGCALLIVLANVLLIKTIMATGFA